MFHFSPFSSLIDKVKLSLHIETNRLNSPSIKQTKIFFGGTHLHNMDDLGKFLESRNPTSPKDLEINVSDKVKVTESVLNTKGNLQITKMTNQPTQEELQIIQQARGNRPYTTISDIQIHYDENGNITSLQWNEN